MPHSSLPDLLCCPRAKISRFGIWVHAHRIITYVSSPRVKHHQPATLVTQRRLVARAETRTRPWQRHHEGQMDHLVNSILAKAKKHPEIQSEFTWWENVQGFYHAVGQSCRVPAKLLPLALPLLRAPDWTEPWLVCLLLFHVLAFVVVIMLRRNVNFQMVSFVVICVVVFFAENLNTFLGLNWREFATQNYFDSGGLFLSTVFSAPLMLLVFTQMVRSRKHIRGGAPRLTCLAQQILALKRSMELVVEVKRLELQRNRRAKAREDSTQSTDKRSSGGSGSSDVKQADSGVRQRRGKDATASES